MNPAVQSLGFSCEKMLEFDILTYLRNSDCVNSCCFSFAFLPTREWLSFSDRFVRFVGTLKFFWFIKGGTKSTEKETKTDFSSIVEYTKKREHLPFCNLQYISSFEEIWF